MIYRPIGKTGMSASIIGIGAEHLDNRPYEQCEEVVQSALEFGINILDVFMPGQQVRTNLYNALKGNRNRMLLQGHIGSVEIGGQYDRTRNVATCRKFFDSLLSSFHTDYMDFGMIFYTDTDADYKEVFETGYIDYVLNLKKEGKIRAIGASSHNAGTAARIVETGLVDLLMFSTNPAYDMLAPDLPIDSIMRPVKLDNNQFNGINPARAHLYELCEQKGVAITTMKTLGAGKLISAEFTPFHEPLTVGQCIHYALTRPAVVSTLIGCQNRSQVLEAVRYLDLTSEERDYSKIIRHFKGTLANKCMYCNHCLPCPSGIDIAAMTKLLDIALLDPIHIPSRIRGEYHISPHPASECIACGSCEANCPFGVKVIENMEKAAELFE